MTLSFCCIRTQFYTLLPTQAAHTASVVREQIPDAAAAAVAVVVAAAAPAPVVDLQAGSAWTAVSTRCSLPRHSLPVHQLHAYPPTQLTNLLLILLRLASEPAAVVATKVAFQGLRPTSPISSRACRSPIATPGARCSRSLCSLCTLARALCRASRIPRWHCSCGVAGRDRAVRP